MEIRPTTLSNGSSAGLSNSSSNGSSAGKQHRPLPPDMSNEPASMLAAWQLQAEQEDFNLRNFLNVVRRRAWVIVGVAATVMGLTTVRSLQEVPIYEGNFRVLVEPVNAEEDFSDLGALLGERAVGRSGLDYETQVQVLRSPELMQPVAQKLQQSYPELTYLTLLENLRISRLGETKILEVTYAGTDPVQIQRVLDLLSQTYLKYSLAERQTNLRQGINFVEGQLPGLQAQVDRVQDQLESFRRTYNFITPDVQSAQLSTQTSELSGQRLTLDRQLSEAQQTFANLQDQAGALAALEGAPVYQQLLQELRSVESKMAEELTRFDPSSLAIRVLEERRANLLPVLQQEAQRVVGTQQAIAANNLQTLAVQSQTLNQAEQSATQGLGELPTLIRQYTDLQRELEISTEALTRFRVTQENLAIEAAQTEIPWQLIEVPTQPTRPISPNLQRSLLMGMIASILLGLGAALLLEKLDNVYHTVDELKAGTKLPLLGTLPYNDELDELAGKNGLGSLFKKLTAGRSLRGESPYGYGGNSESSFLEALRVLHTNIRMLSSDRQIRSILISSALPGDGKSTVSASLAQVATAMGQRVLVVDVDLRKPQVHDRLQVPNDCGLSNLIANDLPLKSAIQQIGSSGQLFVLTAGKVPPDPTKLLASKKMQQLMETFERCFDLVIYDAPPATGLADVSLIGQRTDGLVLVSRIGKTDRTVLSQTVETLKLAQIPVLGAVANGVKSTGIGGYRYYNYGQSSSLAEVAKANSAMVPKAGAMQGQPVEIGDSIDFSAIESPENSAAVRDGSLF